MLFPMSDNDNEIPSKSCFSPSNARANKNGKLNKKLNTKQTKRDYEIIARERVYLSASVTIEAALSMFVFLIVICSIVGMMSMINSELSVEKSINNISMETAKALYYVDYQKYVKEDYKKYVEKGYLGGRALQALYADGDKLISVVNPLASEVVNGNVDLKVSYQIKIPFTSHKWWVTQRAKTKDWTGVDITEEQELVYITKYGSVYHKSRSCSHLSITINETTAGMARKGLNEYGKKYKKCQYCGRGIRSENTTVFITPDGDSMHSDLSCGGLTRRIIEINIKEVGDKKPCAECGG